MNPLFSESLSAVALLLSLAGTVLVNCRKKMGFAIWILSNVLWIVIGVYRPQPDVFQICMFIAYIVFNVHGWLYWKRSENEKQ